MKLFCFKDSIEKTERDCLKCKYLIQLNLVLKRVECGNNDWHNFSELVED